MQNKDKTQLERLLDALNELSPDVTTDDKKIISKKLDIHQFTVARYLNGLGANADIASKLVSFFKTRISEREKAIA